MSRISEKSDRVVKERNGMEIRFNRHPKRQNNFLVAGMYEAYKSGKSLAQVAAIYKKQRQAVYDVFRSRGYKLRTKSKLPAIEYKGEKYTLHQDGYRSTRRDKNLYLHHVIWEEHNGPIPASHYVISIDGNKENTSIENLKCVSSLEAKKFLYNHRNQFGFQRFKGKGEYGNN